MTSLAALKAAIELKHLPAQVHALRTAPLPEGTTLVLRIAAGKQSAQSEATQSTGRSAEVVRAASEFFIEQILLFSGADSYRVLGARPDASVSDLRSHMALLLRWLHPDVDPDGQRAVMAARVIKAWENLKTPERRAAYDASRAGIGTARSETGRAPIRLRRRKNGQLPSAGVEGKSNARGDRLLRPQRSVLQKAFDFFFSLRRGAE